MVRVVPLTAALLLEGDLHGRYHPDPAHPSFREGMLAVPPEGVPDGATVLIPAPDATPLGELTHVVERLLGPGGCPWDREQTHETLRKYLLEEAYETVDAIDRGDLDALREELGDVLLQPVLHAGIRKAAGGWGIDDVARGIVDKLVRRHPHVFGETSVGGTDDVLRNWEAIKKAEGKTSVLEGVPRAMPALARALLVSKRAAREGFEWPSMDGVLEKLTEEEREVREALASGDASAVEAEIGDLLFTVVNVARWAKVDPEEALRRMLDRFTRRFSHMERASEVPLGDLSPATWDALWNRAKAEEGA